MRGAILCGGCALYALSRALADGFVANDEVRCPWHHACFSLRTGEALRAPALDPIQCWHVEHIGEKVFVKEKVVPADHRRVSTTVQPLQSSSSAEVPQGSRLQTCFVAKNTAVH